MSNGPESNVPDTLQSPLEIMAQREKEVELWEQKAIEIWNRIMSTNKRHKNIPSSIEQFLDFPQYLMGDYSLENGLNAEVRLIHAGGYSNGEVNNFKVIANTGDIEVAKYIADLLRAEGLHISQVSDYAGNYL